MKQISNRSILNEATQYNSSFSRGIRIRLDSSDLLSISGTASIDANGLSVYLEDFKRQTERVFYNIKKLLESEGATWKNVYKTTVFIKNISENYDEFNEVRTKFFKEEGITIFPSSTCVEAKLCRPELLIEMDAMAIIKVR